ncbi:MAG: glycosyltransferase [Anaerolineales bacterium]
MDTLLLIAIAWFIMAAAVLVLLVLRRRALVPLSNPSMPQTDLPFLSVIVPARNEAHTIANCLRDLTSQTYPDRRLEVIVVDDSSSDDTFRLADEHAKDRSNIRVIEAGMLPEGWQGKSHACWVGASKARGEWLCFIDADTRQAPRLLEAAVREAFTSGADLLSLHPRQDMFSFWERLLMPPAFISLMILLDARAINNPTSSRAMANGQFILVRRSAYLAAGGHRAIRSAVLEDVRLAERVKRAGYRLQLMGGGELIHTRMYTGLRPLWQGLARSGSELFGIPLTTAAILNCIIVSILPIGYPVWLFSMMGTDGTLLPAWLITISGSVLWYTAHALEFRQHRVPLRYLLLLPLSYLLIAVVNTEGVIRRLSGSRIWKGRRL